MQLRDWKGPWISTVDNAIRHGRETVSVADQLRNLSPGLGNPLKTIEAMQNGGVWTSPWKRGRPELDLTPSELGMKFFGGRPLREAQEQDWRDLMRRKTGLGREDRRRYIDQAVDAYIRGDRAGMNRALAAARRAGVPITRTQLQTAIRGMRRMRPERTLRRLPSHLRREAMELRQGIGQ